METGALAKQLKSDKQFDEAAVLYLDLWNSTKNPWDGGNGAYCLHSCGKLAEALALAKEVYDLNPEFEFNRDWYCRTLNDIYFRTSKDAYSSKEIFELFDVVDLLYEILIPSKKSNIEFGVFRSIKIAKKHARQIPYDRVLKALSYINVEQISDKPIEYKIKGSITEIQSNKEAYYSYKTKALIELQRFEECIECCDEAAENIEKFHNDNDIWLMDRKMQCLGQLGDIGAAISKSLQLVCVKDSWFLKYSLGQLYLKNDETEKALLWFCKAALSRDPIEMKVNLLVSIGDITTEKNISKNHYKLSEDIRKKQDWAISYSLREKLKGLEELQPNIAEAQKYWLSIVYSYCKEQSGKVSSIFPNGKAGYITSKGNSYYFKTTNVINGHIRLNDEAVFVLVESWNKKKDIPSKEASFIFIEKKHS